MSETFIRNFYNAFVFIPFVCFGMMAFGLSIFLMMTGLVYPWMSIPKRIGAFLAGLAIMVLLIASATTI